MARTPAPTDFYVEVEGIGTFSFAKRTMREEMRIGAEFSRYTEGLPVVTPWLDAVAGWMSTLSVLTVKAPDGWSLENLDPLDEDSYAKLARVHAALRLKEDDFRRQAKPGNQAARAGNGEVAGVLVSEKVQPAAD